MTENLPPPSREHPLPEYARITESKFWGSFHYAFSGIMYATRTQPNMRIHLLIAAAVLIVAMLLHLERIYIVALIVMIVIVLSLELFNTAIEAVVDLLTVAHHPLAKTAKDAAAGAVFIASVGAVLVGYLVFYQGIQQGGQRVYTAVTSVPANVVLIMFAVVLIGTILAKAFSGRGTPFPGRSGLRTHRPRLCGSDRAGGLFPAPAGLVAGVLRGLLGGPEPRGSAHPHRLRGHLGGRAGQPAGAGRVSTGASGHCAIMAAHWLP